MIDLAYLCVGAGMVWGSVQDLRTHTVSLIPLLLWCIGSCLWCVSQGIGYGMIFALLYVGLLRRYIHAADGIALCASSAWFALDKMPLMFLCTGLWCFLLHALIRKPAIPMLPAIAGGWFVTHFWTQVTYTAIATMIGFLEMVGCAIGSIVDALQFLI
jgi:hypothetical protein